MPSIEDKTYDEALNVLRVNSTEIGFSASAERVTNYYSVWARDHSICAIAAVLTKDEKLIRTAKKGLLFLLRSQSFNGQVPSYIEIEGRKKVYGGLGAITSVDSNMWVIIASAIMYKYTKDKRFISEVKLLRLRKLSRLLYSFDSNNCGLLEVHVAGDWADVFNRTYHVLYDEVLYYQAIKALIYLFNEGLQRKLDDNVRKKIKRQVRKLKKRRPMAKKKINEFFWFTEENMEHFFEEYMIYKRPVKKDFSYYQSHLTPFKIYWDNRFETFGNLLAMITGVSNRDKNKKIINYILEHNLNKPFPISSLFPPVMQQDKDWEPIYETKEKPFTYHNGGNWPMITGFWIYTLTKNKKNRLAKQELIKFAESIAKDKWTFPEYLHGKNGSAMGPQYQSWSAAGYIIAHSAVYEKKDLFSYK